MSYKITEIEQKYVHDVYDEIASQWKQTRARKCTYWKTVINFINSLQKNSLVGDIGTGDGKYSLIRNDIFMIGSDTSIELLKICKNQEVNRCNAMNLPYKNNIFDATMSVALLHHLSTVDNRLQVIRELIRITKPNGRIYIHVWAFEQEKNGRVSISKFKNQDEFVNFNLQQKFIKSMKDIKNIDELEYNTEQKLLVFKRYCHLFIEGELENLVLYFDNIIIINKGYERGNWYIELEKKL